MKLRLGIFGASVRAAAKSAVTAGLSVCAADLFADEDLRRIAPDARRVRCYPDDFLELCAEWLPDAWLYTGALENFPDFLGKMAAVRPLLGNGPDVLATVRDPAVLAQILQEGGIAFPETLPAPAEIPTDGTWLLKKKASAGGLWIQPWLGQLPASIRSVADAARGRKRRTVERSSDLSSIGHLETPNDWVLQRRIEGTPCAALFMCARGQVMLIGVTRQLIGVPWLRAGAFTYCGSIGPLVMPDVLRGQFERIGEVLARDFRVTGLVGVDAVVAGDEVWVIEVNPRYTASCELWEWLDPRFSAIGCHVAACRDGRLPSAKELPQPRDSAAKAILYARSDLRIGARFHELLDEPGNRGHKFSAADIPAVGSSIRHGQPILSLLVRGDDQQQLVPMLRTLAARLERTLND